jgi:hypothetical protein
MVPTQLKADHRVIRISIQTIMIPNLEVQEKLQVPSHLDLLM